MRILNYTLPATLLLAVCATGLRADVYTFDFTQVGGQVESFDFSFVVPTFVTAGQSPEFTPFTLTDGTNSAIFSTDLVASNTGGLLEFYFGTATNSALFGGDEGGGLSYSEPNGGAFYLEFANPTTYGLYFSTTPIADSTGGFFFTDVGGGDQLNGTAMLTITPAPEPSSLMLSATMLLGLLFTARKRISSNGT